MKGIRIITVLLVCLSMVTLAVADPTMSVTPQPTGLAVGDTFKAEVTVDPAGAKIYAAQYDLYFNSTILRATEQTQRDFLSQGDAKTHVVLNTINNTIGKIEYGETGLGDPETVGGATATGVLASINFEVIGAGVSTLTLNDTRCVTPDDLIDPEPTSEPTNDGGDGNPDEGESSHSSSSGSSGYTSITTPTTAPTETSMESAASPGSDSDTIEDRGTTHLSGETGSVVAESIPPSSESVPTAAPAETASRPESAIPGFAASLAIVGLFAVAIILKSRGE